MVKWKKFNQDAANYSEDRLQILFDNIQHKVNRNYFDNHYPTLFTKGYAEYNGYLFFPEMKTFLVVIDTKESCEYIFRYAKDYNSCYLNVEKEYEDYPVDFSITEVAHSYSK